MSLVLEIKLSYLKWKKDAESTQTYNAIYRTLIYYIHEYYYLHIHKLTFATPDRLT